MSLIVVLTFFLDLSLLENVKKCEALAM